MLVGSSIRLAGLALLTFGAAPATALDYPTRPITLIVSHVSGGPSDVIARVLGSMLAPVLRQPLVIENRPGAGGNIAAEQAAHAAPDGYTLLMGNTSILATSPARQKNIGFDPQLDFAPITLLGTQTNVLVVHPALPVHSLGQLIEHAQANPGLLTFASAGHGSPAHLAGELFKIEAKADLVHVPYKKPGPALQDVVGGHVQMMFAPAALVANHVRAGRLRALAVATLKRSSLLPDVATMAELGHPGIRRHHLVRAGRPGRHAQGDHRRAVPFDSGGDRGAGGAQNHGRPRHRRGRKLAPGVRDLPRGASPQVGSCH